MSIVVYFSSVSGSREIPVDHGTNRKRAIGRLRVKVLKQQQSQIFSFLDSKKIKYQAVDITQGSEIKEEMRKKTGNPAALPPQVFNKDVYCGDFSVFYEAVETGKAEAFFKL